MIELRESTDAEQWNELVLEMGGHPLQLWGWGELKASHGWSVDRVYFVEDDTPDVPVGYLQILTRKLPLPLRAFSYVPRMQLFHVKQSEILAIATAFIKKKYKGVALSVEPDALMFEAPDKWVRATNKILPAETILLDLEQSEDELQTAMAKKTRQYIRKSSKDIVIRQANDEERVRQCLELYRQTSKRAGFALHDEEYYLDVWRYMGEYAPLFIAYEKGSDAPVSFLWMAVSGATGYELYGGMNDRGQELRANYALKWHAITRLKKWGLTKYDFGGIVAGGVATFKQGWAKDETMFAGTYDIPLSPLYVMWSHGLPFAKKTAQKIRKVLKKNR